MLICSNIHINIDVCFKNMQLGKDLTGTVQCRYALTTSTLVEENYE